MKKKLIIVTKAFPYNYTEAFLESEVPYLMEYFDNIVFMPLLKGKVRSNFNNSAVCDRYNELYKKKLLLCIRTFFSLSFYTSLFDNRKNIFKIAFLKACFKQQVHKRIIKQIITEIPKDFNDNTIVYSYWFNAPVYAFLSLREEYNMHYKVVCRAHRWDVYDEICEMPYREFCIAHVDKIFPISQDACNFFKNNYGHPEKYKLSRLGVVKRNKIALSSPPGYYRILTISQIIKRKRVDLSLYAIVKFAAENPSVKVEWTHFGTGGMFDELNKRIQNIKLLNLKIIFKGYVPNPDVMTFIENNPIDVFMNLSSSEGVPVSIMEAQSFGIPVIATDVGGSGEIIERDNGILLRDSPSVEDTYKALLKVYSTHYDRNLIKKEWSRISCAETNFRQFVKQLSQI